MPSPELTAGPAAGSAPTSPDASAVDRRRPDGRRGPASWLAALGLHRCLAVVLAAVVVAPVLASGFAGWRADWFPAGDWAVIELAVRDVGSADTPLVGPYSRYGWNHPGPILFWLLAIPYRLTGASSPSLLAAASVVNGVALGLMVWLAWRRGRLALVALLGLALAAVTWSTSGELLRDPWNPWVTPFALGLLVVAAWSAGEGDRRALVLAVVVGSFLAQSHVGFGPLVAVGLLWAFVGCWLVARRHGGLADGSAPAQRSRRVVVLAAATLAACWLPVLVDLALGGSNMADLRDHFGQAGDRAGWGEALELASRHLQWGGPWSGGDEPVQAVGGAAFGAAPEDLVLPLVVFAAAALAAWRAGAGAALRLQGLVAASCLVGVLSVAQISDGVYTYLIRWWWLLAALWWVSIGWSIWSAAWAWWGRRASVTTGDAAAPGDRCSRRRAAVALAVLAVVVAGRSGWSTIGSLDHQALPAQDWQAPIAATAPGLVDEAREAAAAGRGVVTVHSDGPHAGWAFDALVLQLDRAGVPFLVHDGGVNAHKFGPRRLTDEPLGPEVWVVTGHAVDDALDRDGARLLGSWDPLDPEARRQADARLAELVGILERLGRGDLVRALSGGDTLPGEIVPPEVPEELLAQVNADLERLPTLAVVLVPDDGDGPVS